MLYLADMYDKKVMSIQELAKKGDMPIKFLEQVLQLLKRGGFVVSKRGTKGGYYLARAPEKITLGELIRFIDGPIEPIACVGSRAYAGCADVNVCVLRKVMIRVKDAVSDIVDNVTLKELMIK